MSFGLLTLAVIALIGVLVLVHESGHYLLARLFGVKILRVSLGFGPRLAGFTAGHTEYRLSLIPLGGYVRLLGEDPAEPVAEADRDHTLSGKPLWQRYAIVVAGPAFNLLLPLAIYFVHFLGQSTLLPPTIGTVLPGLPADAAGLVPGDRVETVDGRTIRYWEELERMIVESPGQTLRFGIRRGNAAEERDVTPQVMVRRGALQPKESVGWIGVSPRFHLPEVGVVDLASPAAQAGLKTFDFITAVNGIAVANWTEFERIVASAGAAPLRISYLRAAQSALPFAHIEIQEPGTSVVIPVVMPIPVGDPTARPRYYTGLQSSELFVFSVEPGSPADRIGLRRGDRLLELNGETLLNWELLQQRLNAEPAGTFTLTWVSPGGAAHKETFRQEVRSQLDAYRQQEERLVFGATNRFAWKTDTPVAVNNRIFYAIGHAVRNTREITGALAGSFVEILRGRAPLSSLGGPLTIGYVAGVAAEQGLAQYLWLMALLSINIGLLNFLPIPILDGGLLVFFTIELFKGRPPSRRAREVAAAAGTVIVGVMTTFALKNDLVRFFFAR